MTTPANTWTVNDMCRRVASGQTSVADAAAELDGDYFRCTAFSNFSIFDATYDLAARAWTGPNADVATGYQMLRPSLNQQWLEEQQMQAAARRASEQAAWERMCNASDRGQEIDAE
jgi:hypothetical protein